VYHPPMVRTALLLCLLTGCNAILGIDPPTLIDDGGLDRLDAPDGPDAGLTMDASRIDATTIDAAPRPDAEPVTGGYIAVTNITNLTMPNEQGGLVDIVYGAPPRPRNPANYFSSGTPFGCNAFLYDSADGDVNPGTNFVGPITISGANVRVPTCTDGNGGLPSEAFYVCWDDPIAATFTMTAGDPGNLAVNAATANSMEPGQALFWDSGTGSVGVAFIVGKSGTTIFLAGAQETGPVTQLSVIAGFGPAPYAWDGSMKITAAPFLAVGAVLTVGLTSQHPNIASFSTTVNAASPFMIPTATTAIMQDPVFDGTSFTLATSSTANVMGVRIQVQSADFNKYFLGQCTAPLTSSLTIPVEMAAILQRSDPHVIEIAVSQFNATTGGTATSVLAGHAIRNVVIRP
jgi:hypothetical protein